MRLIDADKIVFDYGGLAHIAPNDFIGIAKYFADQIKAMPTIAPPPNHPLTLEQLREMGGEAVWVESLEGIRKSGFGIVHLCPPPSLGVVRKIWIFGGESEFWQDIPWPRSKKRQEYGKRWIAYRRKPEEEETWQQ